MRVAELVAVPTSPESLQSLITNQTLDVVAEIILQAPAANAAVVNFGTQTQQPGFINAGATAVLTLANLKQTYIKGTGGDNIIIMVPSWDRT